MKEKLSLFCNVPLNAVIEEPDVQHSIYEVPLQLKAQGVDNLICDLLNLPSVSDIDLSAWKKIVDATKNPIGEVTIGMVGKYIQHQDAYKSVNEALSHAALSLGYKLKIKSFEADKLSTDYAQLSQELSGLDGILVPGGFGERGWEGKILTAKYCRENGVPYFGICLGMQVMAVEFARHVLGLKDASSTEIDPATTNPIVSLLTEQKGVKDLGGTMRLGSYRCTLSEGSKAYQAYGKAFVDERHRHRYEFNNHYRADMEAAGFKISGTLPENNLCEISEISDHPWMVAVQFHPEFKSKPTAAHPLFKDFIQAAIRQGGHE